MGFLVGNPYNLTSTVTGIVSAKARDRHKRNSIHSNRRSGKPRKQRRRSGNTDLIGINTMISSTGSYVGYSVPSNIARKIIEDLMEYGNVQRAILGVEGGELNATASKALGINQTEGFTSVQ
jgi:S1-C subfamily serine protease